jgi:hypothetical protein
LQAQSRQQRPQRSLLPLLSPQHLRSWRPARGLLTRGHTPLGGCPAGRRRRSLLPLGRLSPSWLPGPGWWWWWAPRAFFSDHWALAGPRPATSRTSCQKIRRGGQQGCARPGGGCFSFGRRLARRREPEEEAREKAVFIAVPRRTFPMSGRF